MDMCENDKKEVRECQRKLNLIEMEIMKENENINNKVKLFAILKLKRPTHTTSKNP